MAKKNERQNKMRQEYKCPVCGETLITSSAEGITGMYCTNCGYDDYDYDL